MACVIEIDAYTLPSGPVTTLRYSSGRGFTTRPTDTPGNVFIKPRLSQPLIARRDLFDRATTYGATGSNPGELRLINADGGLDSLLIGYAIAGRGLRAWIGTEGDPYPATWTQVLSGTVESVSAAGNEVVIKLADRLAELDKPVLPAAYLGDNALPAGLEGVAGDLKGQRKPRVLGQVFNISPPCVNTSRLIYQVSDQACSVSAVYDRGVALTAGAAYATRADLQATAPAAGQYRVYSGSEGAYLRLGSSPAGTLTCDAATSETRAAALAQSVLSGFGISPVSSADVAALNAANGAAVGMWVQGDTPVREVLDRLLGSIGAWYGFDRAGALRMARLEVPGGAPVAAIRDVTTLELLGTADSDKGHPAWRVRLGYAVNGTPQSDSELGGDKTSASDPVGGLARRAWLAEATRTATAENAGIKTAWPLAPELEFETCLAGEPAASVEAARRLALYTGRTLFQVRVPMSAALAAIEPGNCVTLQRARWGLSAGKLLRVIGVQVNFELNELTLRLWG